MEPDLPRVGEIRQAIGQSYIPIRIVYGPDVENRPRYRGVKSIERT